MDKLLPLLRQRRFDFPAAVFTHRCARGGRALLAAGRAAAAAGAHCAAC
jgi:hypothetical protein